MEVIFSYSPTLLLLYLFEYLKFVSFSPFCSSGNTNVRDGLPKYVDLPAAFGGSDKQVDEVYHQQSH